MPSKHRVTRRNALKLGAAATALPLVHIRTAGAAGKLKLALWDHWVPTGDAAMKKLVDRMGREEQGRGGARLPYLHRQQDQHHHGRRGAGQDRPRRLRIRLMDSAAVRRQPRSDGRRDAASHREIRQARSRLRVSRRCRRALAGGAGRLGLRAADVMRAHQPAEEVRQYRRAGLVPGASIDAGSGQGLDLRHAAQDGGSELQGWLSHRLWLRFQQHRRQPDLGRDVRRVRRRPGRWQRATSPSNPTT